MIEWQRTIYDPPSFWKSIAPYGKYYNPSSAKALAIQNPALRYLQRFMSYTILDRGHSNGVIGKNDLFFLWCMKEKKKINGAYFLYSHMEHIVSKNLAGSIVVRGMVTVIVKSFGFNPD